MREGRCAAEREAARFSGQAGRSFGEALTPRRRGAQPGGVPAGSAARLALADVM